MKLIAYVKHGQEVTFLNVTAFFRKRNIMKCLKHCTVRMLIGDGEGQPIKGNIVGQYKMQTVACKIEQDKNSPIVF